MLRTHTSPVQVRTMLERHAADLRRLPGPGYRTDELDATHTPVFHQVEGLAVDQGITMAHLQGHPRPLRPRHVRRRRRAPACGPRSSRSPSRRRSSTCGSRSNEGRRRLGRVGRLRHGQPATCCAPAASTRRCTPASRSAWGIERTLQFRNGIRDMRDMVEGDVRFSRAFGV